MACFVKGHKLIRVCLASLVTAIVFHQLFEGLSLGIRIAGLPPSKKESGRGGRFSLLKTTLMFSFSITTPVGICAGLVYFARGPDGGRSNPTFTEHI
jgi:zinc transporter 1/2/3